MKVKTGAAKALGKLQVLCYPIVSFAFALGICAIFMAILGFDWVLAYKSMLQGSLGSVNAVAETLVKAIPLIFTGLSFAIGKRCGLINLGAEGQVYLGGLFATFVGISLAGLPAVLHLPLTLLAGAIGGGLLGLFTGWLKNRFGASELITGIMLNYMAIRLISYFVTGPLKEPGGSIPQSEAVALSAQLPRILSGTRLHAGLILALLCILFYYIFLWKTTKGYELRLVGLNRCAAQYSGINTKRSVLLAMFIAGCFAGIAGSTEILGVQLRLFQDFSPNYGFDGIAVALLGNNSPLGILFSGILFGLLRSGSSKMLMATEVPVSIVQIIQSLVILFVIGREMLNIFYHWLRNQIHAEKEVRS
ncbi:MAG: ABC transporter permease [Bacillota bacterium]